MSIYEYDKELEEKKLRKAEYEAGFESGKEAGFESGKEAGFESGKREMILNMHQEGFSLEQISKVAKIESDEVRKILGDI